jgi:hypothetical protein
MSIKPIWKKNPVPYTVLVAESLDQKYDFKPATGHKFF